MVFISNVAPAVSNGPASNVQPLQVAQAAGAAGAAPTAQQLLPTAVVATTYVPPKPQDIPKPNKQILRNSTPSSALAAQLMAQNPDESEETLSVFDARNFTPTEETPREAELFVSPRMPGEGTQQAQGQAVVMEEAPSTQLATAKATTAPQVTSQLQNFAALGTAVATHEGDAKQTRAQLLHFSVQQAVVGRKSSLTLTRGAAAYMMTGARIDQGDPHAGVEAIS